MAFDSLFLLRLIRGIERVPRGAKLFLAMFYWVFLLHIMLQRGQALHDTDFPQ